MKIACPDDERLADYLEGRLLDKERFQLEAHMSECEVCLERLAVSSSLLDGTKGELDTVPQAVTEAAVRLVKRKGSGVADAISEGFKGAVRNFSDRVTDFFRFTPWGAWQLQPVRSAKRKVDKNLIVLQQTFKDIETEIEIERIGADQCHIRILFPEKSPAGTGVRVTLKSGDREIASYLAEKDHMVFENIPFGRYGLTLAKEGVALGAFAFEITETGCGER
jgi:hypothetical protein